MQEATTVTGVSCLTAAELQHGWLDEHLLTPGASAKPASALNLQFEARAA
jgi:hypothetical protein